MTSCTYCGAELKPSSDETIVTCPYCGTTLRIDGKIIKLHYMLEVSYTQQDAYDILLQWVSKQVGAPPDVAAKSKLVQQKLTYYPFWIIRHEADTTYTGLDPIYEYSDSDIHPLGADEKVYRTISCTWKKENGEIKRSYTHSVAGREDIPGALKDYRIPLRRKAFFDIEIAKKHGGIILNSLLDRNQAETIARQKVYDMQTSLIYKEIKKIEKREDNINPKEFSYTHVPTWLLKYKYGLRKYTALVDAASGRVIHTEYPRSPMFRIITAILGLMFLGAAGGSGYACIFLKTPYWILEGFKISIGKIGLLLISIGFAIMGAYSIYQAFLLKPAKEK